MVFKKLYRKGKKFAKNYLKSNSAWSIAKTAWNGVKALKNIINSEKNLYDKNSSVNADYNGTVIALSDLAQGDGVGARTGNSILAKSLHLRLQMIGSSAISSSVVRVIVFQDTMSLGTVPSASDILAVTGASQITNSNLTVISSYQYRFKILCDKIVYLSNTGTQCKNLNIFKRLNSHIKYTGATGTDEGRNMMYMLVCSNQVTTGLPIVDYNSRLQYYDN